MLARTTDRAGTGGAVLRLALTAGWLLSASTAVAAAAPTATARHAPRHMVVSGLEGRVRMLSKRLGLDAKQQADLRKVLEDEREQVRRVWNDPSLSGPYRVSATRAISDRTGDRIRELLNEEQRKKYNPRPPPRDAVASSEKPGVEYWMSVTRPKPGEKADPHVDPR